MVYLNAAATTRPFRQVVDTIADVAYNHWGNPSASGPLSDDAKAIVENVRKQFADDLNCSPDNIVFTSGGCEANSLAFNYAQNCFGWPIVTTELEHKSIENAVRSLGINNHNRIHFIENNKIGSVSIDSLDSIMKCNLGAFVSVAFANSEIGVIQDIKAISDVVHKYCGILHVDAVQMFPWNKIDVQALGIDMMTISGQKFHAGRGCGILYVKNGIDLQPIIYGGQERGKRGGTENTASIAGMGKALELTRNHDLSEYVQWLRDGLLEQLLNIPGVTLNGPVPGASRLVNNINITIDGVNAEKLVTLCAMQDIYISKGSACNSYNPEPSSTLKAIGLTDEQAFNTVRITLDTFNTEKEINYAASVISKLVDRIRTTA